jgi:hypothetical protein
VPFLKHQIRTPIQTLTLRISLTRNSISKI